MTQRWSLSRRYFINGATQIIAGLTAGGIVRPFAALAQTAADFDKKEWIIGFSNASETNTWRTALREAIEAEARNTRM